METIKTITDEGACLTLTALTMLPRVLMSTTLLLTRRGFLLTHELPDATPAKNSFVAGVKSVCDANIIGETILSILGFVIRTTAGMVWLLNNFVQNSHC